MILTFFCISAAVISWFFLKISRSLGVQATCLIFNLPMSSSSESTTALPVMAALFFLLRRRMIWRQRLHRTEGPCSSLGLFWLHSLQNLWPGGGWAVAHPTQMTPPRGLPLSTSTDLSFTFKPFLVSKVLCGLAHLTHFRCFSVRAD